MKKRSAYDVITDRILQLLDQGVVPWRAPWHREEPHSILGHTYRGFNRPWLGVIAASAGYERNVWLTFEQAKQRGGAVRKGEKGTPVVFWKALKFQSTDDETGETSERGSVVARHYTVFNLAQIDGELKLPKKELEFEEARERDNRPIPSGDDIVEGYPNAPTITKGGQHAFYRPSTDSVQIPHCCSFDSSAHYYSTLFHELTHSTGHPSRLARASITNPSRFGSHEYSQEELVAEFGSAFLMAEAGLEQGVLEHSAAYIDHWKATLREHPKALVIGAAQAQKAADYILGREGRVAS